jgi:tubulin polyglutamylase TTLL6/13
LVAGVDPLRIFLYKEGMARFATHPYVLKSSQLNDVFQHLTNYAINKENPEYFIHADFSK